MRTHLKPVARGKRNLKDAAVARDEEPVVCPFHSFGIPSLFRTIGLLNLLILMMATGLGTAFAGDIPEDAHQKLKGLKIPFILNEGQTDKQVKLYARTFSGTVYVTDQGRIVYGLPADRDRKDRRWVLVEETSDGLPVREIKGAEESETKVSYFLGNDRSRWKESLPTYEAVDMGEVYQGITLKLRAYGGSVEKLYYIGPGKDPGKIRMKVRGAESLKVNDQGELEVQTGNGPVIFSRPRAFQQEGSGRVDVEVSYLVNGGGYSFRVGSYDVTRELVIDPLIQSTYLGGTGTDWIDALAVSGGYVYVAGTTYSSDFPGTAGGAQPAFGGSGDGFVSLLSGDLTSLTRSTYLGGRGYDGIRALAVSGGYVYVTGETGSTDFPVTALCYQSIFGGSTDGFVSLLSGDLTSLTRSTYLGGPNNESSSSIALYGGDVYVAGVVNGPGFPGTAGGAQPTFGGSYDGFVSKLNGELTSLTRSTYFGGSGVEFINALAVSGANVYVAGRTLSDPFPGTTGGAQEDYGGGTSYGDGFVSKLDEGLTVLSRSTYLGGSGEDTIYSLVVSGGYVYVAGRTLSDPFPGTAGGAQEDFGGGSYDGFVSKLNEGLTVLSRSTYLGGSGYDGIESLAVSGGYVYVAGYTMSSDFPGTAGGAQENNGGGSYDGFVSKLNGGLTVLSQSTYLGGSGDDGIESLAVSGGYVYVAGTTYSSDFPVTAGGAQEDYGGSSDGFVSLLSADLSAAAQGIPALSEWGMIIFVLLIMGVAVLFLRKRRNVTA